MSRPGSGRQCRMSDLRQSQFFECHIGCQMLATRRFVELLTRAGFRDIGGSRGEPGPRDEMSALFGQSGSSFWYNGDTMVSHEEGRLLCPE